MKKLLFMLLLASPAFSSGPKYNQKDPLLNDEFDNVYKDIQFPVISVARISTATITNLKGITDGSSPCSGCVGELKSAYSSGANSTGTGLWFDVTSISLTPGRWVISAEIQFNLAGATATKSNGAVSTHSGNDATGLIGGDNWLQTVPGNANVDSGVTIVEWPQYVSSNTTIYMKSNWAFSAGTPNTYGRISARRI